MKTLVVALALAVLCAPSFAGQDAPPTPNGGSTTNSTQEPGNHADGPGAAAQDTTTDSAGDRVTQANKDFLGVNFSFGFGAVFFHGRIEEAQVIGQGDDARVVITKDANKRPALVLEAHRLLDLRSRSRCFTTRDGRHSRRDCGVGAKAGAQDTERVAFGLGPFLALQTSQDDKVIDTIGLGVMGGFHISEGKAFNLGIGAMLDPSAKFLPPGYVDGQPPPKGYVAGDPVAGGGTSIPLVSKGKLGLMVLASFTF